MRHVEVAGVRLPVIGLGAWQFGSAEWGYGPDYLNRTAVEITRRALDLGVSLLDTAEIYGFGRSERAVGKAIEGRRDEALVATKLFPVLPTRALVTRRLGGSLKRLGTDHVDLYQLHWPNPVWPLKDTLQGMRELMDSGAVRHFGVSNHSLERWQRAEELLGRPALANQVQFNLLQDGARGDLVPHAAATGRAVIAYSPLAQGLLSGRYGPGRRPSGGIRRFSPLFRDLSRVKRLGDELREIGRPYGATPSQVALAWVVRHPNVVAIPGASSVRQLEENADAGDLILTDDDDERLRAAAAAFRA